jgi:hypothetical protein
MMMILNHPLIEVVEVEEEEEEEEEEVEEVEIEKVEEEEVEEIDHKDKIQSKALRKPKKISQPYEREDLFDLPSKELADSFMVNNGLLIILKRFL